MIAYLAPEGFEEELARELPLAMRYGRLFLQKKTPETQPVWVQNCWLTPQIFSFSSLGDAAKKLRELACVSHTISSEDVQDGASDLLFFEQKQSQNNNESPEKNKANATDSPREPIKRRPGLLWAFYPHLFPGKGKLIAEKLPYFKPKPLCFPCDLPKAPLGSWMFLDETTILASPRSSSPFAHGEPHFHPSKIPPSRAYLKLWELFTLTQKMPQSGDLCLDIGASPGSWSWAIQKLGASVRAVDRAPLCQTIASLSGIYSLKKDAFSLEPDLSVDWLFSDAACTPEKLLAWIRRWLEAGSRANMICTLKFQGFSDSSVIREFKKIENSRIVHLSHNKHELTWMRLLAKESPTLAK